MQKTRVFLSLGSNIEPRKKYLEEAVEGLDRIPRTKLLSFSSIYETKAWGKEDQDDFYNIAVEIETALSPHELLKQTQKIELALGRERKVHWGPRTVDIDLLLFGEETVNTEDLKIPHPLMTKRRFVLEPLQQVAGELKLQGRKIGEILEELGGEKAEEIGELFKEC